MDKEQKFAANGDHPLSDHPLFTKGYKTGMMTGEKPMATPTHQGENAGLKQRLNQMGLHYQETKGKYGSPENSLIIHGPTKEQMFGLGKEFGQESVVHGENGNHKLLYTSGSNEGMYHDMKPEIKYYRTAPQDNFTEVPGRGFFSLDFDFDKVHPSGLGLSGRSK